MKKLKRYFKRKFALTALTFSVLLLVSIVLTSEVQSQPECMVKIEAPTEVVPNTDFNVSIIAENVPDQSGGMYGWQLILKWNASTINCTGEVLNYDFWSSNSGPLVADPIDNAAGTYRQALSARAPSEPVTGTYWLVNLTFHSADTPTPIDVTMTILPDVENGMNYCIVDKLANEIPHGFGESTLTIISEFLEILLLPLLMISSAISLILANKFKKNQ